MDKEKKHFEMANIEELKMLHAAFAARPVTPSAAVLLSNVAAVVSTFG